MDIILKQLSKFYYNSPIILKLSSLSAKDFANLKLQYLHNVTLVGSKLRAVGLRIKKKKI